MDVRVCAVREWIAVRVCGRAGGASAGAGVLVCNGHVEEHDRGREMRFVSHTSDVQNCVLSSGLFIPRRRFLVYSWTWGMSLPLLQKIAAKAAHDVEVAYAKGYEDGLAHNRDTSPFFQDLAHLEHLGDDGKYLGICKRMWSVTSSHMASTTRAHYQVWISALASKCRSGT